MAYVKKKKITLTCTICGEIFQTTHHSKITCGETCSTANTAFRARNKYAKVNPEQKRVRGKLAEEKKHTIDPKFLVRGNISNHNRADTISNGDT